MGPRCARITSDLTRRRTLRQGHRQWPEFPEFRGQNFRNPHKLPRTFHTSAARQDPGSPGRHVAARHLRTQDWTTSLGESPRRTDAQSRHGTYGRFGCGNAAACHSEVLRCGAHGGNRARHGDATTANHVP
jgi:hypothetical protein